MATNETTPRIVNTATGYAKAMKENPTEPVYAAVRFGSDKSGIFSQILCEIPLNEAAWVEFFGDGKSHFTFRNGDKLELSGIAAALAAKAKHAYEGCRNEAKSLSFMDDLESRPWTAEEIAAVQRLFDDYTGPSGKRAPRAKKVSEDELQALVAKYNGDFVKAARELGILK